MSKVAVIFGGQGSQYENLGKVFIEKNVAPEIYGEIKEYEEIIKNGSFEEISMTKNLQPIMLAYQLASLKIVREKLDIDATCGLSLGEYASLVAANVISAEDALKLIKIRGKLMQECGEKINSKMLAILNKNEDEVKEIIKNSEISNIFISNINSPKQILIAGEEKDIDAFKVYAKENKIRNIEMKVSGAFHTKYMGEAAIEYKNYLEEISFSEPKIDYYLNLTGKKYSGEDLKLVLSKHIENPVRLYDCLENIVNSGVNKIIEIGPSDVLSKIIAKNFKNIEIISLKNEEEVIEFGENYGK
ncbi:ACP S-malonyltransferase [Peptoniphilus sp. MSJ-1]|uniref:Malonyl CoA-acyl carrier protein transacylase n=1 Tax=Peptoniphilus ovalis TaxID=2841503 RepID=A0ABS6FF42_9FIRM|nr:ACP S-malonyltransferase [Peptoniphilus ovalis]MBU5668658.1 ACP S-malonyltransferase [Peptoniphilus ovalis]